VLANDVWPFSGSGDRADVNKGLLQCFIVRQLDSGWYLKASRETHVSPHGKTAGTGNERGRAMKKQLNPMAVGFLALGVAAVGCGKSAKSIRAGLTDEQLENLVRRSYQYVAMYNVNNKFAQKLGGWNTVDADTQLKDHTMREIARPNNDTLYISCLLDLRKDPVVLDIPVFGSDYTSLMVTAYDHYVNVPLSTIKGDFQRPEKMLFYSARTEGYRGEPVDGVDRVFETSGDFVSAVFRVMPHAGEPERFRQIVDRMKQVRLLTLSQYRGGQAKPIGDVTFPPVGATDADVFGTNLADVMQFVFDHTTFDPNDAIDQGVLAAWKPLGVEPGKARDAKAVPLDGARVRQVAERIARTELARANEPGAMKQSALRLFHPKGQMDLDMLLSQSVIGPIGLPASEAVYPAITTADGAPMNTRNDYVIRMAPDALPPAKAFWSITLYDLKNGFFIPNDRKKYSVGKNAGMKLDAAGGIAVYIAAEKPRGVPEENWLPIERKNEDLSVIMRLYAPDLKRFENWTPPRAEKMSDQDS